MEYKLIKKLPFENSPGIGYISKPSLTADDKVHYWNGNWFYPEEYPEFWEKIKVVEKDYEILCLLLQRSERHEVVDVLGLSYDYITALLKCQGNKIYSVKRLSDSEIFTIGDKVKFQGNSCSDISHISKIIIENNFLYICSAICQFPIKFIEKIKQPLFTTEDGVDIFKGDFVFQVKKDNYCLQYMSLGNNNIFHQFDATKINNHLNLIFSTKEKAEEYILMNKPCLSLKDVKTILNSKCKIEIKLRDLVKQKLK